MSRFLIILAVVLSILGVSRALYAQQPAETGQAKIEEVIGRISSAETALIDRVRTLRPMVEAYIQDVAADPQLGHVPTFDTYFLGRFGWREGPRLDLLSDSRRGLKAGGSRTQREYQPDGFAAMAAADWGSLDAARYEFKFVRREFLGEARTLVFDVTPRKGAREGFSGRIWVEDRGYNIVRFNGINRKVRGPWLRRQLPAHIDGWRVQVQSGVWVPAYTYCEESAMDSGAVSTFKSQIKLWGYESKKGETTQQFTAIEIAESAVVDAAEQARQLAPVLSQRRWEQEAESNIIERLEKAGLLSPPGEVEKVLDTVINNLEVTNDITLDRPVRARVLLTSPLESFTVGHTIVVSRGLIDVLPDEASLAMMLAHELGHVVLGHQLIDTRFAYADRMMIDDADLLKTLAIHRDRRDEIAVDKKVMEMLDKSPYKDKLSQAGLFLRIVALRAKQLPNLIQPHIGEHITDGDQELRLAELMLKAPELVPDSIEQVPALPLGSRLILDPWSNRLELLRSAVAPASIREKVPLAVTPLTPYIKYADGTLPSSR